MNAPEILFSIFMVAAFCAAILDHWFYGRGHIVVPLRAFLLGCFVFTESYVAVHDRPLMWLYVSLNIWGLWTLFAGKRARGRK